MAIPSVPGGTPEDAADPGSPRPTDEDRYRRHARWFIQMRWFAVLVTLTLVVGAVPFASLLPPEALWPLLGTVAVLAGTNVLYTILLRRNGWPRGFLSLQAYVDLGILTVLLHFSGGIENPLSLVGLFHVIHGGIILPRRQAYAVAVVASALFALLAWVEWSQVATHYPLRIYAGGPEAPHAVHQPLYIAGRVALQLVVYLLAAYFIATLADRARQDERQLETLAERAMAGRLLLEHSLATTGAGLCVLDADLRYQWMNDQWRAWFGPDPGGLFQLGPAEADRHPARECLRDGTARVTEVTLAPAADAAPGVGGARSPRILQVTTAPLRDVGRPPGQVVMLAQDVTEQRKAHERMTRDRRLAAIGELAGHVAHEVNNPMAILIAKLRLLQTDQRGEMSDKVAGELTKCVDQGERVARLAQTLLSYGRPSTVARVLVDIRLPLRKALAMVDGRARSGGVRIVDRLSDPVPPVRANADELAQVFLNLLLNALDAMPDGGQLAVSAQGGPPPVAGEGPIVEVTVEDTGHGMTPAVRDRLFEPFFTTKDVGRGTGLGLSICLGIVQGLGGAIDVESRPGRGSRFTVRLPVAHQEISHG
jgi:signal transduction histidine kinase